MLFGSGAAVVLRIALTVVAVRLLEIPYLQIVGGALLLYIGVQLLSEQEGDEGEAKHHSSLLAAVRTILIAELLMSLDNVIAVAAAAKGSMLLLVLGLAISIPLVVFGSTLMIRLMERDPFIVTLGAALVHSQAWLHQVAPVLGTALVFGLGRWLQHRAPIDADRT